MSMDAALDAIRRETMTINKAAAHFKLDTDDIICTMIRIGFWPPPQWKTEAWRNDSNKNEKNKNK